MVGPRADAEETPRAAADAFVEAVRVGVLPVVSGADPRAARVEGERTVGATTTLDFVLPPMSEAALAPLVRSLMYGTEDVQRLRVEATSSPGQELRRVAEFPPLPEISAPFPWVPVPTHRATLKHGTLRVQFADDLPEAAGEELEAAIRAWFRLVEVHGFTLESGVSSGFCTDAGDAFPDEWVFQFQFLTVDAHACRPLLRYLADIHAVHPITEAGFSW
ncbi:MAG: hypothetical protein U0414_11250 [Polyangiaceae bacterium]